MNRIGQSIPPRQSTHYPAVTATAGARTSFSSSCSSSIPVLQVMKFLY